MSRASSAQIWSVRHDDFQTDRQTDRQTGRQAGRQADRQTGRQACRQAGRQADRLTDRQTSRQAGRQTDRQTRGRLVPPNMSVETFERKAVGAPVSQALVRCVREETCDTPSDGGDR